MDRQTQKILNIALDSIRGTWEAQITLWEFMIKYRYWDISITKDSEKIWIIQDWIIYINNLFKRFQFLKAISKNYWQFADVISKRVSELKDKQDKIKREKRESERKQEEAEKKVEQLEKQVDDLQDKLAKVIVDVSIEDEPQKPKRRNNR